MSQIKNKNKNNTYLSKSEIDFYKMCVVFAIACAFVVLVLRMNSTFLLRHATGQNITYNFYMLCRNPLFLGVSIAAGLAAVVWFVYNKVKKVNEKHRILTSTEILGIAGYVAVFYLCFGLRVNSQLHTFFMAFTIIACGVFCISKIYNRDFSFYSLLNAFFAITLYGFAVKSDALFLVLKLVLVAEMVYVCVRFAKKNTKRTKSSKALLFIPCYISLAIWAVFMFWRAFTMNTSLLLTVNAMLIILLVQYLVAAIFYTIRLIRE